MEGRFRKCNVAMPACTLIIALFVCILVFPTSREIFRSMSTAHPFIMGFFKFYLLATSGELIALRITNGVWAVPAKIFTRALIWGMLGALITLMLKVFSGGIGTLIDEGILPAGWAFIRAFVTSVVMNITFAPVMMGFHKMSYMRIEMKAAGEADCSLRAVVRNTDWENFIAFIICKTIPIFWIPAHTVTFLLPPEYQALMAAVLSIALGIILSLKKKQPAVL